MLQMSFYPALSREFRPYKPDPAPLLHICTAWEVQPDEVMMIGDSLKDDGYVYCCPFPQSGTISHLGLEKRPYLSLMELPKSFESAQNLEPDGDIWPNPCQSSFTLAVYGNTPSMRNVACGKRAGAVTCLLDETGRYDAPEYANVKFQPDYRVSSLTEVYPLLESNFDLTP
ncbi:hypothetical protein RJ639_041953 [Escallonia herrerae]|uniref:Uncharacterized protein n=1 Tax=Escallonia herrerae TaxID=1293975 RepID=A0AA88WDA2_9ASTE|nr:hypothetical protein RJ639_041953 [Escallonia herrerae]